MGASIGLTLVWLVPGIAVALTGESRWRSRPAWFVYSLLLWPAALAHRVLVPPPEPDAFPVSVPAASGGRALVVARIKCRWCAETIRADSVTCPICTRRLESGPTDAFDWPPWRDPDSRILAQHVAVPLRFVYVSGDERSKRRILADHLFEWAETLYVRGHEASRGATRSFRLDRMQDAIDERTGEALDGVEAIRDALLCRSAPSPMHAAAGRPATMIERAIAVADPPLAPVAMDPLPPSLSLAAPVALEGRTSRRYEPPPDETPAFRRFLPAFGGGAVAASMAIGVAWLVFGGPADTPRQSSATLASDAALSPSPAGSAEPALSGPAEMAHVPLPVAGADTIPNRSAEPAAGARADRGYDAATRRSMEELVESLRQAAESATPVPPASAASFERPPISAAAAPPAVRAPETVIAPTALVRRSRNAAPHAVQPHAPAPAAFAERAVAPARAAAPLTSEEVRELQTNLARLGYRPGPIDGIFGPRTGAALAGWQRDRDLIPAGHPPRALHILMRNERAQQVGMYNEAGAPAAPTP